MLVHYSHEIGDGIMASETVSIAMTTLAMIPCVIFSTLVYTRPDLQYTPCDRYHSVTPAYLPIVQVGGFHIYAPLSTSSNLCYVMGGLTIYLYNVVNGAFLHMQLYGVAITLVVMGAGSAAMHSTGGVITHWAHAADIYGILIIFMALSGASFIGAYQSFVGSPQRASSKKIIPAIVNTATILGIGACVYFWEHIDQTAFLVSTGTIIIVSNGISQGIYARRSAGVNDSKTCAFIESFLVSAVPRVAVLASALYINLVGRNDPYWLQVSCRDINEDPIEILKRIEALKSWDWIHGVWHYLSSTVLTSMALSSQQGLDGMPMQKASIKSSKMVFAKYLIPFAIKTDEYVEELVMRVIISIYAIVCAGMYRNDVSSDTWAVFVIISMLTYLPFWCMYSSYSINRVIRTRLLL